MKQKNNPIQNIFTIMKPKLSEYKNFHIFYFIKQKTMNFRIVFLKQQIPERPNFQMINLYAL